MNLNLTKGKKVYDWLLFPPPDIAVADEQEINEYIFWQNLVLPKDFRLPDLPKSDRSDRTDKTDGTNRLVMPPSIPKPAINIDQKLEELKKKAERKRTINN